MSKYDPLRQHLARLVVDEAPLTFAELERVLGFALPASARRTAAWWANTEGTHVQAAAWRLAGWRTSRVDIAGESILFVRDGRLAPGVREDGDGVFVPFARLSPRGRRLIESFRLGDGKPLSDAVIAALDAAALERRRALADHFAAISPKLDSDSTELIREVRDSR